MRKLIETEGLPQLKRPQTVWKKSLARKTASVLGVLALSVSAIGPQPASTSQEFEQIKSPNPILG